MDAAGRNPTLTRHYRRLSSACAKFNMAQTPMRFRRCRSRLRLAGLAFASAKGTMIWHCYYWAKGSVSGSDIYP